MISLTHPKQLALLIDAENMPNPNHIEDVLKLCAYYGELGIKDAYADWGGLIDFKKTLEFYQFFCHPVQHLVENAADYELMLDIGTHLASNDYDIFIIVSGDKGSLRHTKKSRMKTENSSLLGTNKASQSSKNPVTNSTMYIN